MKSTTNQPKEHVGYNFVAMFSRLAHSCCCVSNLRHPAKFSLSSNLYSSRSSKVIVLGVNQKRTCNFLLVINSNCGRISYSFQDIDAFSFKIACFPYPTLVWCRLGEKRLAIST